MPPAKKTTRANQTRNQYAIKPVFVSQHTAPVVLGFKTERAYLEWLPTSGCRVVERGRDRLVLVEEAEAALLRECATEPAEAVDTADASQPANVGDVLARIGRVVGVQR